MEWLKLRLRAFRQGLPHSGYGLTILVCAVVSSAGLYRKDIPGAEFPEVPLFVIAPALLGLSHILAPRETWGGTPYWALTVAWLAGAVCGALAHWSALDPWTPWLSLARYVLLSVAVMMTSASPVFGRLAFSREQVPRCCGRLARFLSALYALGLALGIGWIFYQTPFRLSLAPRYPGATVRRLFTQQEDYQISRVFWSPDGQRLLVELGTGGLNDLWLISPRDGSRTKAVGKARIYGEQPWFADSSGFLFLHTPGAKPGLWRYSLREEQEKLIVAGDKVGYFACSPDGMQIAYTQGQKLWLASNDGTHPRLLADRGSDPIWSSDGTRLVYARYTRKNRVYDHSYWVQTAVGRAPPTQIPYHDFPGPTWLNNTQLITSHSETTHAKRGLSVLGDVQWAEVWDLRGKLVRRYGFKTGLGFGGLAPSPDGQRVAVHIFRLSPLTGLDSSVFVLDTVSGALLVLPTRGLASVASWSPDDTSLAFVASEMLRGEEDSFHHRDYLGLITGL